MQPAINASLERSLSPSLHVQLRPIKLVVQQKPTSRNRLAHALQAGPSQLQRAVLKALLVTA